MNRNIRIDRLQTVIDDLRTHIEDRPEFLFSFFNVDKVSKTVHTEMGDLEAYEWKDHKGGSCGTAACVLGRCPLIWPQDWHWDRDSGFPSLKDDSGIISSSCIWFGVDSLESAHLFYPNMQNIELFGGIPLDGDSTAEEVARNMEMFLPYALQQNHLHAIIVDDPLYDRNPRRDELIS